jgi:hypothetical protein
MESFPLVVTLQCGDRILVGGEDQGQERGGVLLIVQGGSIDGSMGTLLCASEGWNNGRLFIHSSKNVVERVGGRGAGGRRRHWGSKEMWEWNENLWRHPQALKYACSLLIFRIFDADLHFQKNCPGRRRGVAGGPRIKQSSRYKRKAKRLVIEETLDLFSDAAQRKRKPAARRRYGGERL